MNKNYLVIGLVILIIILILVPHYLLKSNSFIAKAEIENSSNFVESAGYYESFVTFKSIDNTKKERIFICTKDWDWLKNDSCYIIDLSDIAKNQKKISKSSELSGCYTDILKEASCS